jgi:tRNA (guanine37-N1)-methyltransferase
MIIDILTIFPGMMAGPLQESIIGKAIARELIEVHVNPWRLPSPTSGPLTLLRG